jgi:hypothetical protein
MAIRDWLGRASVDHTTGLPPDAKVAVTARLITTIGHLAPGQSEPENGMNVWSVTATMYLPSTSASSEEPTDAGLEIAQILTRLEESLEDNPTVEGGLQLELRGTVGSAATEPENAPAGYPLAVEVLLTATHI